MKKYMKFLALALIIAGLALFMLRSIAEWARTNAALFAALALIAAGIAVHTSACKKESRY